jgi:hypothetical protein
VQCSWDDFTTLGLCSTCEDVTPKLITTCIKDEVDNLQCSYDFPGNPMDANSTFYYSPNNDEFGGNENLTTLFQTVSDVLLDRVVFLAINATTESHNAADGTVLPSDVQATFCQWQYCAQKHTNVVGNPSGVNSTIQSTIPLSPTVLVGGNAGYLNYTPTDPDVQLPLTFEISNQVYQNLRTYLTALMDTSSTKVSQSIRPGDTGTQLFNIGYFLRFANISQASQNLATTVTSLIRSQDNGDNRNATIISGKVVTTTTFVRVRWPWLILPILETLLAAVLLIMSIIMNRGRSYLYKSSSIALLFHGLEGWKESELPVQGVETPEHLEEKAKTLKAVLTRGTEGSLKLVRS